MGSIYNFRTMDMRLEEQFSGLVKGLNKSVIKEMSDVDKCVEIAENFTIQFIVWAIKEEYNLEFYVRNGIEKQLLEIYKETL